MDVTQLELPGVWRPGRLRESTQWLLLHGLECGLWTRRMHSDHCRYLLAYFGDCDLSSITYQRLREYKEHEAMRIANESIRKRLVTLHMVLEEAVRRELIEKLPPWVAIKGDSRPKEDFWGLRDYQIARLTEEDEDFRAWLDVAFWCGSHTGDIYRFRWCDIKWDANTWVRRNTKNKAKPWPLPMPDELRKLLWERYELHRPHDRDLVCGRNFGHPNRRLRDLCKLAGVSLVTPTGAGRRSCGTYLAEQGASEDFQRLWFGHSSDSIIIRKHYRRPSQPIVDAGMRAINARR